MKSVASSAAATHPAATSRAITASRSASRHVHRASLTAPVLGTLGYRQGYSSVPRTVDIGAGRAARSSRVGAMLSAKGVTVSLGGRLVLNEVSVSVAAGDRLGIVGPNGIGKTTLLRALAGRVALDAGAVERAPASLTVGFLPQETDARPGRDPARRTSRAAPASPAASAELDRLTDALGDRPDAGRGVHRRARPVPRARRRRPRRAHRRGVRRPRAGRGPARRRGRGALAAGRPRAPRSRRSCSAGSTSCCSTSRPTTSTSPASTGWSSSCTRRPGAVVVVSHDRAFLDGTVRPDARAAGGEPRGRWSTRARGATTSRRGTSPAASSTRATASSRAKRAALARAVADARRRGPSRASAR